MLYHINSNLLSTASVPPTPTISEARKRKDVQLALARHLRASAHDGPERVVRSALEAVPRTNHHHVRVETLRRERDGVRLERDRAQALASAPGRAHEGHERVCGV